MTACCSAGLSGIEPPEYAKRYFAIEGLLSG
jgi:hypothetical protein